MLFNEPKLLKLSGAVSGRIDALRFSALQRAEIAEIVPVVERATLIAAVSVLFNEPKLLKIACCDTPRPRRDRFSALQRAEIAEIR